MARIAIIADDLTGASDSGVQFARKHLRTVVLFDPEGLTPAPAGRIGSDVRAVAIDTDSRAIAPAEARERSRRAAQAVRRCGFEHLFKKVDSTLRGNLGPEIDGILDEIPVDLAVVAPAFPRLGRTTFGGRHFLRSTPLEETEIARDPKSPVRESVITRLLATQTARKTGRVDLSVVREGDTAMRQAVQALLAEGVQIAVFDALEEQDLIRTVEAMAGSGLRILWVGSAGLAEYLPAALGLNGAEDAEPEPTRGGRPVMLVAGSVSPVTREQVIAVRQLAHVTSVELDPLLVVSGGVTAAAEVDRCQTALAEAVAAGHDVLLVSGSAPEQVAAAREQGAAAGLDGTAVSDRIAAALGQAAALVAGRHELGGLIMTGGDTAKAICRRLGVSGLEVLRELEPGVPLSRLAGGGELLAVTKAGAFGDEQTLVRALRYLKGEV